MEKKLSRLDRLRLDMGKYKAAPLSAPSASRAPVPSGTGIKPLSDKAAAAIAEALRGFLNEGKPPS